MGMQVTYNGTNLDNGTYRRITGRFGDNDGLDGKRVLIVDFYIYANDPATLQTYKKEVEDAFNLANGRLTLTLDSTAASLYADVAPNDGRHSDTACVIVQDAGKADTATRLNLRLMCVASIVTPSAAGGTPGSSLPAFAGLVGSLTYGNDFNAGRVQAYRVMGTWTTTFDDDANGPYTITAVSSASGKAKFTISTAPVAFESGQRLKVTAGTAYLGIHVITAIDVAAKTITTDTAFVATATGTGYIGEATTGLDNYLAARATLLTDYLHCNSDGARGTGQNGEGMVLSSEVRDTQDQDGNQVQVFLQSTFMPHVATNTASARGMNFAISREEPERWNPEGGARPLYLTVSGSVPIDRGVLGNGRLYAVWEAGLKADIEAALLADSGEAVRPLAVAIGINSNDSTVAFTARYQARNAKNVAYTMQRTDNEQDDTIGAQVSDGFDYDQRPPGLKPKTVTITAARIGIGDGEPFIPEPKSDAPGSFYQARQTSSSKEPFDGQFGAGMFSVTKSVTFLRRKYKGGGAGGFGGDNLQGALDQALRLAHETGAFGNEAGGRSASGI